MLRHMNKSLFKWSSVCRLGRPKLIQRYTSNLAANPAIYSPKTSETIQVIRRSEAIHFDNTYHEVLRQLSATTDLTDPTSVGHDSSVANELSKANQWFAKVIDYNVPHGKRGRGLMAIITYHMLATDHQKSDDMLTRVRALGWALELFQTYFLIIDDIMDKSITRRGRKCWYRQEKVGLIACNDATLIESGIYHLIKLYFKDKPYYMEITELIHDVFRKTAYGQCMDLLANPGDTSPDLNHYTYGKYSAIIRYKTSYYTFVMPVRLAMYLSDYNSPKDHQLVEDILLKIGYLFQAQDDYLDCFGDSFITGKIGTDIEDGKCCWPIVTALTQATDRQKQILAKHYGNKDYESVKHIRQVYEELNLDAMFKTYEKTLFNDILAMIDLNKYNLKVPVTIFNEPLAQIYNRNK